jgi:non-ribosomal peptide synthase protein (TIGR01720 family)
LFAAYEQASQGVKIQLPFKTSSYKQWAARLVDYARSKPVEAELPYWLANTRTASERGWDRLPLDFNLESANLESINIESSLGSVRGVLSEAKTQALLREAPAAYNTEIGDILLTALAQAIQRWKENKGGQVGAWDGVQVALEGHGREDIGEVDVTRTVGWFTSLYPVNLELPNGLPSRSVTAIPGFPPDSVDALGNNLMAIKEQLRRIPQKGIGYGLLRYLNPLGAELGTLPIGQLSFNYLGQINSAKATENVGTGLPEDASFKLSNESTGAVHDPRSKRSFLIDVVASITNNQLRVEWLYSQNLHQQTTIETLANMFLNELEALITHCTSTERQYATAAVGYTPSDFPEAKLSQAEIEDLMDELALDDYIREDDE